MSPALSHVICRERGEDSYSPAVPEGLLQRSPATAQTSTGSIAEELNLSPLPPMRTTGRHRRFRPLHSSPDRERGRKRMSGIRRVLFASPGKSPHSGSKTPPQASPVRVQDEQRATSLPWKRVSPTLTFSDMDDIPARLCSKRRKNSQGNTISTAGGFQHPVDDQDQMIRLAMEHNRAANLVGDFTRECRLPVTNHDNTDLRFITPDTMADLLQGRYDDDVTNHVIIDCRYPYEYDAGHITGADNIYTRQNIRERFLSSPTKRDCLHTVVIFHCEFSSQRAPALVRYLRGEDRKMNLDLYPRLYYPEVYILEGGYKAFYEEHLALCTPQDYKPMVHDDHVADLKHYRSKANLVTTRKRTPAFKSRLEF